VYCFSLLGLVELSPAVRRIRPHRIYSHACGLVIRGPTRLSLLVQSATPRRAIISGDCALQQQRQSPVNSSR